MPRWSFLSDAGWMPFGEDISAEMDGALRAADGTNVRQTRNNTVYEIDVLALTTRNTTTNTTRRIRPPAATGVTQRWLERAGTAATLARLRANDSTLLSLDLSGGGDEAAAEDGGVDDDGAAALGNSLLGNGTLTSICLRGNRVCEEGAVALCGGLGGGSGRSGGGGGGGGGGDGDGGDGGESATATCSSALTHLDLRDNLASSAGATALGSLLESRFGAPLLASLDLRSNGLREAGAAALGAALRANATLTVLNLTDNSIGDEGAAALGGALGCNGALTCLNLHKNGVGDAGAVALSAGLAANCALQRLSLYNNSVGDAGAAALGGALRTNRSLTCLSLMHNRVGDDGAAPIFALGCGLQELMLGGNHLTLVPPSVARMRRLRSLSLLNNKLVRVDAAVGTLVAAAAAEGGGGGVLATLDLRGNGDTLLQPPSPYALLFGRLRSQNGGWVEGSHGSVAALGRYFRLERRCYSRVKLMLIGDEHGGKTSSLRMLREGRSCTPAASGSARSREQETVGVEVHEWRPSREAVAAVAAGPAGPSGEDRIAEGSGEDRSTEGGEGAAAAAAATATAAAAAAAAAAALRHELVFSVWDLAGQTVYRASHQCTFSEHALYVCAQDARDSLEVAMPKVLGWYDYLQDSVPGALFRLLLTHIDTAAAANWREKGAELLRRLHAHQAARRRALEERLAALAQRFLRTAPPAAGVSSSSSSSSSGGGSSSSSGGSGGSGSSKSMVLSEQRALARLLTLPGLQPRQQGTDDVWGVSNLTGEGVAELRARLVAVALDKELLPHVGEERPAQWMQVEALARQGGSPRIGRAELLRRAAAAGVDEATVADALWFWHEVGMLIHYRHIPQLSSEVFVDTNWILKLVNGLIEQAHRKTFDAPELSKMIKTGVLQHRLLARLWRDVAPPVRPADESTLLALMSQFDLLLPGPEPDSSFVPLLLPATVADTPVVAQRGIARHWPGAPGAAEVQAGARFLFLQHRLPPGLVARLLARCAAIAGCRAVHCWRGGMLARVDASGGDGGGSGSWAAGNGQRTTRSSHRWLCVQSGRRPDPDTGQSVAFVDVLLRATTEEPQVACHAAAPFVEAARQLLRDRFAGLVAEQKLLCPHCVRASTATPSASAAFAPDIGEFFMVDCEGSDGDNGDGDGGDGGNGVHGDNGELECQVCFLPVWPTDLVPRGGAPPIEPAPAAAVTGAARGRAAVEAAPAPKRQRIGGGLGLQLLDGVGAGGGYVSAPVAIAPPTATSAAAAAAAAAANAAAATAAATACAAPTPRSVVANAKRCVVQLGVYDRATRHLLNLSSGALLKGGRVLTAAHNVLDMRMSPPQPLVPSRGSGAVDAASDSMGVANGSGSNGCGGGGRTVLIGVFAGDDRPTRWAYTAEVLTPLELLREQIDGVLLDLCVLQITASVTCDPPSCLGKANVLGGAKIAVVREDSRRGGDERLLEEPSLCCDPDFQLRAGEDRVTVISYAAAAGSHIFVSPENVVNLSGGYLQTRGFIDTGSSGGPVINEAGDIVSVVSRTGTRASSGTAELAKTRLVSLLRPRHFGHDS
jgi:GTPase SAR1 family protein